jgi:hypothetical protein
MDVYCLVADETHAFALGNGVVVSNCFDELKYAFMSRPLRPRKVIAVPSGTFSSERSKYLRARDYAKRYGTTLEAAYQRVR